MERFLHREHHLVAPLALHTLQTSAAAGAFGSGSRGVSLYIQFALTNPRSVSHAHL